jgi:hypothetical protein
MTRQERNRAVAFRIVAGAIKNVMDVHPGWIADKRAVNSIAKRAAGTLTAYRGTVLAPSEGSIGRDGITVNRPAVIDGRPPVDEEL